MDLRVNGSSTNMCQYWGLGRRVQDLVHSYPHKVSEFRMASGRKLNLGKIS